MSAGAIKGFIFSARWVSLLLLALSIGALTLIGLDKDFYLTNIPIEGVVSIPPGEIVTASGLGGAHVFSADPDLAAARIAELPGIIAANVTLNWPNRVLIEVTEDSPVAIWLEGGQQYWITQTGQLIPSRASQPGLLLIESEMPWEIGVEPTVETAPTLPFLPPDVLAGALQLRQLRPNIDRLYYRPASGLSYQDGRGWRVHFGTGSDMQQKLVVYETIVEDLLSRDLSPSYISVSNQRKPYYMAR